MLENFPSPSLEEILMGDDFVEGERKSTDVRNVIPGLNFQSFQSSFMSSLWLSLDDHCVFTVCAHAGFDALRCVFTALPCTCRSIRQSFDSRDDLWHGFIALALGAGEQLHREPNCRSSKRIKQSGKYHFFRALAAQKERSMMLIVKVTEDLKKRRFNVARLKKHMRELEPVDLNTQDQSGFTVLNLTTSFGHFLGDKKVYAEMFRRGADPNIGDANGMTPLINSAACGDIALLKLFLAHGAHRGLNQKGKHPCGWKHGSLPPGAPEDAMDNTRFKGSFTAQEWAANYGRRDCERELVLAAAQQSRGA
jgi:hypothetical protein